MLGAFSVNVVVFVPIAVPPFLVTTLIVPVPETALGIWVKSVSGGVQVVDAPTPVATVPVAVPKLYVISCVNEVEARFVLIVTAAPASKLLEGLNVAVEALGIVDSVRTLAPVEVGPARPEVPVASSRENVTDMEPVPSVL